MAYARYSVVVNSIPRYKTVYFSTIHEAEVFCNEVKAMIFESQFNYAYVTER